MIELTILGASAACPAPGGASSSYLVRAGDTTVVLDCGPGSMGNLRQIVALTDVDAVVLSHVHADHILDLVPFHNGLCYAPGGHTASSRVPLHAPPGSTARLRALGAAVGDDPEYLARAFAIKEYDPAATLMIGDLHLRFVPTQHYLPCWAIRVESGDATLVYTADTGPIPWLADFARDADLLLAEATLLDPATDDDRPGHLTAAEAGILARAAGARQLVLTHLWPELGVEALIACASTAFGGPVTAARELDTYQITGRTTR